MSDLGCWNPPSLELAKSLMELLMSAVEPNTGIHTCTHTQTYGVEGAGLHVAHPVEIESKNFLESFHTNTS